LFESLDALAIADHSRAHRAAVRKFAAGAEKYYNRAMHGYGPYKGDRSRETVWFDDNGWWGIAFVDAWRATGNRRYLKDADRVLCDAAGDNAHCQRAAQLADAAYDWFGQDVNHGPQFDTIYLRSLLYLYSRDQDRRSYDLAVANAQRAQRNAHTGGGVYLAAW